MGEIEAEQRFFEPSKGEDDNRHSTDNTNVAPFGDAYEKIGTIQRRLAWPLHKDDTLFQSGRPTGLNIYRLLEPKPPSPLRLARPHRVFVISAHVFRSPTS